MADKEIIYLEPVILNSEGKQLAPNTLTNHVYDPVSGESVDKILERIKNTSTTVFFTRVLVLEAEYDEQCVFNLDYPIDPYDLDAFPVIIMIRNAEVGKDKYTINVNESVKDQLIINNALIQPLHKGETVAVIFHYADTMYNGSIINAQTINGITIIDEKPTVQMPDNTIFFDFANSQIVFFKDNVETRFKIGPLDITRASMTITEFKQEVQLNIPGYNSVEDQLLVYENSTYVIPDDYYTIDENLIMRKKNNVIWQASIDEPITFDFIIYKNSTGITQVDKIPPSVNVVVPPGTIDRSKFTPELLTYMNEVKLAADKIEAIQGAVGLKEARPINQIHNSDFSNRDANGLPINWVNNGGVTNDNTGKSSINLSVSKGCASATIDISKWSSEYTRLSFSFVGNGTVQVSTMVDNKVKPIRKFSDTAFGPHIDFKSTDIFFWQNSGSLIIEPGNGLLSLHFDCIYGNIDITEVMIHPIYTIDEDMNYAYSKGKN